MSALCRCGHGPICQQAVSAPASSFHRLQAAGVLVIPGQYELLSSPSGRDAQGPVHGADELRGQRDLCLSMTLSLRHPHTPCLALRGVAGLRERSEPGVQLGLTVCYLPDVQPEPGILFCCLLLSCVCEIWPLSVSWHLLGAGAQAPVLLLAQGCL